MTSSPGGNYSATDKFGYLYFSDGKTALDPAKIGALLQTKAAVPWCIPCGNILVSCTGNVLKLDELSGLLKQEREKYRLGLMEIAALNDKSSAKPIAALKKDGAKLVLVYGIGRMCHIAFWEPHFADEFSSASNAYSDAVEDADVDMFVQRILLLSFTVTATLENELVSDAVAGIVLKSFLDSVKKKLEELNAEEAKLTGDKTKADKRVKSL